jgi:hypothetical protein
VFAAPIPPAAPYNVRQAVFPDLRALTADETFTLTWEGLLSLDQSTTSVDGPPIRVGALVIDSTGMHLKDAATPFCGAGVEPYDIVALRGCDPSRGNGDCPLGYTCYVHPESKVAGLGACMASDEADRLADACKEFLTSTRRYTVARSTSGELLLAPRKHVLRTTPVDGCTTDTQCQALANYALREPSSANPVDDNTAPDPHTYHCEADPSRGDTLNRCVEACPNNVDSDCEDGFVCQNGRCMEGVTPPQACVNSPQRYDLRGHDAFVVIGTRSGYIHPIVADKTTGQCVRPANANPLQIGRIPLTAPPCDPTADPRTGLLPNGTLEANPCQLTVTQTEIDPVYQPNQAGTCNLASPATALVNRSATAIQFRDPGLALTMVDPTYPGDAQCIGDRMGGLGNVPLVASLYQLVFRLTAGLVPYSLPTPEAASPVKVLRGPTGSIWVIDDGDFLSSSLGEVSTQGKVFRVESQYPSVVNALE